MNQTTGVCPWRRLTAIFFILLFSSTVPAVADTSQPRLEPDPDISRIAVKDEPMIVDDLTEAALIASGLPPELREPYRLAVRNLVDRLPVATGDVATDGEAILQWMHQEVLDRYVESQTRLDVLLDRGTYNCVSSAVLYMIFASARAVPVYGVLTSDHAFCRVPLDTDPEGGFDVETTILYGFDPGRRHDAVDSFSGRTGFVYVPPSNYRSRQNLGEKEMIALIYQNRLATLQRSGKWIEAVGLSRDRWELAANEASRNDFITALNNYAAEMNRRKEHVPALLFLAEAQAVLGDGMGLEDAAKGLLNNAVALRLRVKDTEGAREILEDERLSILVTDDFVDELYRDIQTTELEELVSEGSFNDAVAASNDALAAGLIRTSRWEEFTVHLWSEEARSRSSGGNWLEGWKFLNTATGDTLALLSRRRVLASYENNSVVTYHNRFVDAARAGRLQEATLILDEAQLNFPDDRTLIRDRQTLDEM